MPSLPCSRISAGEEAELELGRRAEGSHSSPQKPWKAVMTGQGASRGGRVPIISGETSRPKLGAEEDKRSNMINMVSLLSPAYLGGRPSAPCQCITCLSGLLAGQRGRGIKGAGGTGGPARGCSPGLGQGPGEARPG